MVANQKNTPVYSLEAIRAAASDERVQYVGRKVSRDVSNLGYSFDDVLESVKALRHSDYVKTVAYEEGAAASKLLCDVYNAECSSEANDETDPIYLKLFLKDGTVYICSFHLP